MLKEWKLYVPHSAHVTYERQQAVLRNIEGRACDAFGGFTVSFADGGWRNSVGDVIREPVDVYTFAIDTRRNIDGTWSLDGPEKAAFESMVSLVRLALEQEAVYRVTPDGPVID